MLEGSCACGRVRYRIARGLLGPITYCHCWRCRKHSGSSFGTTAAVAAADFEILEGRDSLSSWESSPGVRRHFAACCGSPIYKQEDSSPAVYGLRLGTLDSDPGRTVSVHYMVESSAPWVEIRDGLEQRRGGDPPGWSPRSVADGVAAVTFRKATAADVPELRVLIAESARRLARADYTDSQIEAALTSAWGVDSQLIADGTYFVAEAGVIVGCGGWSWRATLFGGDAQPDRQSAELDPARDAARIRAFFVHPDWSRRGIGKSLLRLCEDEARAAGFRRAELVATLPGERLYRSLGYSGHEARDYPLPDGQAIRFIPMQRSLN